MDLEQPFQKQWTDSEVGNQGQIYLNEVYLNSYNQCWNCMILIL